MRVALVSTLARPVPPPAEGSIELLVSLLAEGLVARGHDVTLYAVAASHTSARLRSPVETSYVADAAKWDWQLYESWNVREAFRAWHEFDVVHTHSYHFGLLFCDFVPLPSVHSIHVEPGPDLLFLARQTRNRHLVFASRYHGREFDGVPGVHLVPHGIDISQYYTCLPQERQSYLAYLGRFEPDKGIHAAVSVARRTGRPLYLAGPESTYFRREILPLVDGTRVRYLGEIGGKAKADFLSRAHALLYPSSRGEPFGLVLVEALASGLPVIALKTGAVPEIIDHGVTGCVAETEDDMVEGVQSVMMLDRSTIRDAAQRFSNECMVTEFERLYVEVIEEAGQR